MKKITTAFSVLICLFVLPFAGCSGGGQSNVLYPNDASQQTQLSWTNVQPGLAFDDTQVSVNGQQHEFFLVKVDPHLYEFQIYNNNTKPQAKSLQDIHLATGSLLTFNGAFFDKNFKAMGLLQDSNSQSHAQGSSSLMNGIFSVANKSQDPMAMIYDTANPPTDTGSFQIQNGPILLDNSGDIALASDTGKTAARTALAVDNQGNVILIILRQDILNGDNGLSLYQFAHLLKENILFTPLGLHSALNLDGGPSTGVVIAGEYLPEMNSVQNAVITVPRQQKL